MKEYSAGAVIFHGNKVLVIHQKNGNHFGFPKGHIEPNEHVKDTAIREVFEEVGLRIKLLDVHYDIYYEPKPGVEKKVTYFLATSHTERLIIQTSEIHQAFWFDVQEAIKHLTYDNDKKVLLTLYDIFKRG